MFGVEASVIMKSESLGCDCRSIPALSSPVPRESLPPALYRRFGQRASGEVRIPFDCRFSDVFVQWIRVRERFDSDLRIVPNDLVRVRPLRQHQVGAHLLTCVNRRPRSGQQEPEP
jgi:hypothetical protein